MTRPITTLLLSAVLALGGAAARAASPQPAVTANIGQQSGNAGRPAVTIDLSEHFGLTGVLGQLVRFDTAIGSFDVMLRPDSAPNHVANFLAYTDAGLYDASILHRSAKFSTDEDPDHWSIIQGGGVQAVVPFPTLLAETFAPVNLEYSLPNARGTLAAARTTEVNSATSQWYFNIADNSETLGTANGGGYSVFGEVLDGGMEIVDLLATINTFNLGGGYSAVPLRFYSGGVPTVNNFTVINRVFRIEEYPVSAEDEAALSFTATSSNNAVATVAVTGSTLAITTHASGTVQITVRASTLGEDQVEQTFTFLGGGLEVTGQPASVDVAAGGSATFQVTAIAGDQPIAYQWYHYRSGMAEPVAVAGGISAALTVSPVSATQSGAYFVRMTAGTQSVDSDAALLTTTGGTSRLANLSTRGRIIAGQSLTPGFVLRGNGAKPLLVRGVGPGLAPFLGDAALANPKLEVIPQGASAAVQSNDNWSDAANAAAVATTSNSVGAFALEAGSADAALLADFALPNAQGNRGYTARIQATTAAATGIAIAEIYDPQPLGSPAQLVNVSALGYSGVGTDALIPGFVIEGDGAKTMLIRVVGPSIAGEPYNVPGTMTDPRLRIMPLGQNFAVASNDNWGGTAELKAAFGTAGAFAFRTDASLDAAVLVRLPPGGYTVVVEGATGGTGIVLVEAYDLN